MKTLEQVIEVIGIANWGRWFDYQLHNSSDFLTESGSIDSLNIKDLLEDAGIIWDIDDPNCNFPWEEFEESLTRATESLIG